MTTLLRFFCFIILCNSSMIAFSQSVHQSELEQHNALGNADASFYESHPGSATVASTRENCNLQKTVYGWHPYWSGNAYLNYQWNLLSHLSFFSYEVDYTNGNALTTHGWATSAAVDAALASGNTKVTLCVTLFANHTSFLGNTTAKQTLITNLINLVNSRGAHGVNIDFEGIPSSQATTFANFMVDLANQMHTAVPNSEVSTVLYSVDWGNVFDFSIMEPAVDQYIIMGYGYYYGGSATAGPTDPLYQFGTSYNYTLSKSITTYIDAGCPRNKLIMGLPFYGYEWPTTNGNVPTSTTGAGTSRTYAYVNNNTSGNYSTANHQYDNDSFTDIYSFTSGTPRQCHITEEGGFDQRLRHILRSGIGGIGIWALGYDDGYSQLWDAIETNLTDCRMEACSGDIWDFGGPTKNYYNNEDYTWTIAPANATSVTVDFSSFFIELNYDYLYIYDGNSTVAPQIAGSPFTGTTSPGSFTTSTGAVTFRFTSDGATVDPGFLATYTCSTLSAPISSFQVSSTTICQGDSILLQNTSQFASTYLWSTDEGMISNVTDENPYFYPSSSGVYTIQLEATNSQGTTTSSNAISIIVETSPTASATVNSTELVAPGAIAYFNNTSSNATSYFWDFGNGTTSTDTNPWNEYTGPGTYTVMLIAEKQGCGNDTTYFTIHVGMLGISDLSNVNITLYPNPFSKEFTITGGPFENASLFDLSGKLIRTQSLNCTECTLDMFEHLTQGMYLFVVKQGEVVKQFKLLKE